MRRLTLNAHPFMAKPQARQCCYRYLQSCGLSPTASDALEQLLAGQGEPAIAADLALELRWAPGQALVLITEPDHPLTGRADQLAGWQRSEKAGKTWLCWSPET